MHILKFQLTSATEIMQLHLHKQSIYRCW